MAAAKPKKKKTTPDIITFKVDDSLREALEGIKNRSEFIRSAILGALDNGCPLCKGTGVLTPHQKRHWEMFSQAHPLKECATCHERHLTCSAEESVPTTKGRRRAQITEEGNA